MSKNRAGSPVNRNILTTTENNTPAKYLSARKQRTEDLMSRLASSSGLNLNDDDKSGLAQVPTSQGSQGASGEKLTTLNVPTTSGNQEVNVEKDDTNVLDDVIDEGESGGATYNRFLQERIDQARNPAQRARLVAKLDRRERRQETRAKKIGMKNADIYGDGDIEKGAEYFDFETRLEREQREQAEQDKPEETTE